MTMPELMTALRNYYDGRKIYYQKWYKKSIRIGFRKYNDEETRFKSTIRVYKLLIYGKLFPVNTFKKIHLKYARKSWYIDIELADDKWIEREMKKYGYRHAFEVMPDIGIYRNNVRIDDEMVLDNNRTYFEPRLEQWWHKDY